MHFGFCFHSFYVMHCVYRCTVCEYVCILIHLFEDYHLFILFLIVFLYPLIWFFCVISMTKVSPKVLGRPKHLTQHVCTSEDVTHHEVLLQGLALWASRHQVHGQVGEVLQLVGLIPTSAQGDKHTHSHTGLDQAFLLPPSNISCIVYIGVHKEK